MTKIGKIRVSVIKANIELFGNACAAYHHDILNDEAKANIVKYRNRLLALGTEREHIDNFETYVKKVITGVREMAEDSMITEIETLVEAVALGMHIAMDSQGNDVNLILTEAAEKETEGMTDDEIRAYVEERQGPLPIKKK